jgi:hypothetical protein
MHLYLRGFSSAGNCPANATRQSDRHLRQVAAGRLRDWLNDAYCIAGGIFIVKAFALVAFLVAWGVCACRQVAMVAGLPS